MMRLKILFCLMLLMLFACTEDSVETVYAELSINPVEALTTICFESWEAQHWIMGESTLSAQQNENFRTGVHKVCQARAELYAEGYEIYPLITDNSQREIYALVFSADVESIKAHLKEHLPKLRVI